MSTARWRVGVIVAVSRLPLAGACVPDALRLPRLPAVSNSSCFFVCTLATTQRNFRVKYFVLAIHSQGDSGV